MPFADVYRRQVTLLIRLLPLIAEEQCFALKGGTAINLFIRDMPRLSVDIDLTYVPLQPYNTPLAAIDAAMGRIATRIKSGIPGSTIAEGQKGARTQNPLDQDSCVRFKSSRLGYRLLLRLRAINGPITHLLLRCISRGFER
jgi:hypothetical protein